MGDAVMMSTRVIRAGFLREMEKELHDLCQPVTSMQCRLELGKMGGTSKELLEAANGALEDTDRIFAGRRADERAAAGGRRRGAGEGAGEVMSGKTVVLASADVALRQRLKLSLGAMRWNVREASGGAEAMAFLDELQPEAVLVDSWLPDLEASEFAGQICLMYPGIDLLRVDGDVVAGATRSPRRHELLHALREAAEFEPVTDGAAWASAPVAVPQRQEIGSRKQEVVSVTVVEEELPSAVLPRCGGDRGCVSGGCRRADSRDGGHECKDGGACPADSAGRAKVGDGVD